MTGGLVGRVAEVAALDRLRAGSGAAVFLVGEAGVGKTAVVEEAVSRARAAGARVLAGRAEPDEGAPAYWPLTRAGVPAELFRADDLPSAAAARFQTAERVVRWLTEAAPLVLVLEVLHWADDASIGVTRRLCAAITGTAILVIGTVRQPDDRFPLADFAGLPGVEVCPLGPLDQPAVGAYLARYARGPVHGTWPAMVHRLSGGNPLYARELARLLDRAGRLSRPATEVDLPDGLRRLVGARTAQLSRPCQELLGGAAALGAEIDLPVLRAAVPDPAAVDALLAEAVDAGVLVDDPWRPAMTRFAHDLVRQVRYRDLSRPDRIEWHRRFADALTGATPAEIARHRVRAAVDEASREAAVAACREAARSAARTLDHAEAARWYGRALELSPHDSELLLARAEAEYRDGRLDAAVADCGAVQDLAEHRGDAELAAEAALVIRGLAGPLAPRLIVLCERALGLLGGRDGAAHARVLAQYAFLLQDADQDRAESISRTAMAMAERSGQPEALVAAVHARHEVLDPYERPAEVLELAARSRALARDSGHPDAELWGRTWQLDTRLMCGEMAAFHAEFPRLVELADRLGWPLAQWHVLRYRTARALLTGAFAEAESYAVAARDLAARSQDESAKYLYFAILGALALHTGQLAWTEEVLNSPMRFSGVPIGAAQVGLTARLIGDRELGRENLRQLSPVVDTLPADSRRVAIWAMTGELAAWLGDRDVAGSCYRRLEPLAHLYVNGGTSCYGSVARALGDIAAGLGDLDAAERHLTDAVAMEERIGALPFLAQARLSYARMLTERAAPGDGPRARSLADQAASTARRLGMPKVAAEAGALAATDDGGLTAREREIAGLAASGLPNRAIAEMLVLSERTVESHVRNALAKLGLRNRTQLAARFRTEAQ
jgi:DNA-binding CsgD family transcriptional regulator